MPPQCAKSTTVAPTCVTVSPISDSRMSPSRYTYTLRIPRFPKSTNPVYQRFQVYVYLASIRYTVPPPPRPMHVSLPNTPLGVVHRHQSYIQLNNIQRNCPSTITCAEVTMNAKVTNMCEGSEIESEHQVTMNDCTSYIVYIHTYIQYYT